MRKNFQKKFSKLIYQNDWIKVVEFITMNQGKTGIYTVVERQDSVVIIPLTPQKKTLLLKQFRYPTDKISWEFPMGGVDKNETAHDAAKREFIEETQIKTNFKFEMIGSYYAVPGLSPQLVSVFTVRLAEEDLDKYVLSTYVDEIQGYKVIPVIDIFKLISKGIVTDGLTIASLTLVMPYIN